MALAESESTNANNLDPKRKYEQKMLMAEGLRTLVKQGKMVIGGKNGDDLLGYFGETADLVNGLIE